MRTSLTIPLTWPVVLSGWAFSPGPEQMDEPTNSQFADEISEHSAKSIAASLLAFPGTELLYPVDPSWYQWKARWQDGDRFIGLDMTLFDDEETWGGSEIEADCLAGDIVECWSFLQARHSGIWLHAPDCTMHTQQSFLKGLLAAEAEQSWPT